MSLLRHKKEVKGRRKRQAISRGGLDPVAARAKIEAAFKKQSKTVQWMAPAIAGIWLLAAAYYFLMPPVYHSKWSLILPVASNGSTVTLETIGQTTSSPSQPFGNISLSPKVVYKEIVASEQVRAAAAKSVCQRRSSARRASS